MIINVSLIPEFNLFLYQISFKSIQPFWRYWVCVQNFKITVNTIIVINKRIECLLNNKRFDLGVYSKDNRLEGSPPLFKDWNIQPCPSFSLKKI